MALNTTSTPKKSPSDAEIRATRKTYLDLLIKSKDNFEANLEFTTTFLTFRDRPEPEVAWKTAIKSVESLIAKFDTDNSAKFYFEKKLVKSKGKKTEHEILVKR